MKVFMFFLCFFPGLMTGQTNAIAWQDFSFGSPALKVRMPGAPRAQEAKLPPQVQQYISAYEAFYLKDDPNGIVITVMHILYADVVADGHGAIEGTNGQWEANGTKVAILGTSDTKISGKTAIKQRGKLIMGGQEHDYMDVVIVDGPKLWQVIIMTKANDAALKTVMQKVTDSISF